MAVMMMGTFCHILFLIAFCFLSCRSSEYQDPYPEIYPSLTRPKKHVSAAVYTGNPAKGGGRRGWVEVKPEVTNGDPRLSPPPPESNAWQHNDTQVQVLIAAFRDDLCGKTLFNLFTKAEHPDRLKIGVVQQNSPEDMDCLNRFCTLLKDPVLCERWAPKVTVYNMPSEEARGPVHARSVGSRLLDDSSPFCMQIDSHMDFSPSWDKHLMRFWAETKNEYAVLSTYVANLNQLGVCVDGQFEVPHLCQVIKSTGNVPRNSQAKAARMLNAPLLTTVWGAGFSFARCHFERRVPNDPNLPFVFDGEEFSRTLRGWTWGYDFYTPPRTVVGHNYNRVRKGHWKMTDSKNGAKVANRRMQLLLDLPAQSSESMPLAEERSAVQRSRYGLGTRRTVDQYKKFSGIDTGYNPASVQGQCTDHDWVPWNYQELRDSLMGDTQLSPADDKLWPMDQLSWPPPLEGSLSQLERKHDPAFGGKTFQLKGGKRAILKDDDDHLVERLKEKKKLSVVASLSSHPDVETTEGTVATGKGVPLRQNREIGNEMTEVVLEELNPSSQSGRSSEIESGSTMLDKSEGVYFFDITFHGMLPLFLGRFIGLAIGLNLVVILKLLRPMSPHRRYLSYLYNLLQATFRGMHALFVTWRHRPKRTTGSDKQNEESSLKVV